jgi:hypothetical protein
MPVTSSALAEGAISREHAQRLAWAAAGRRAAAFADGETELVGLARSLDGHDFVRAISYWRQLADDDAAEAEALGHHRDRWCQVDRLPDGRVQIRGTLDRVAGTTVMKALDRLEKQLFDQDWAAARERWGREPIAAELGRTSTQRRADALVSMAERAMAAPPGSRLPDPLISFHVGASRPMFDRLCELSDGTVATPGELLRILPIADLERILWEAPDRVQVSEKTRRFRGATRRAVEVRDRSCTYPGCRVPADECEIDHVIPFAAGGLTTQENGRPRCPKHHPNRRRDHPWLAPDPEDSS